MPKPEQPKQITIKELARYTNLSIAAVSLSLVPNPNATIRVSEETRRRVRKAAEEFGYLHNRAAQVLRKGKSNVIGILSFQSYFQLAALRLHDAIMTVTNTGMIPFVYHVDSAANCTQACEAMLGQRVDGILLVGPEAVFTQATLDRFSHFNIPVVAVGKPGLRGICRYVPDKKSGFETVTRHLIAEGYRSISLLCCSPFSGSSPQMRNWTAICAMEGFKKAIEGEKASRKIKSAVHRLRNSLNGSEISEGAEISPFYTQGYLGGRLLVESKQLPEALVCQSDGIAAGAMRAFAEAGLKVPWDIAVTGFGNDPVSSVGMAPLTTVEHPIAELNKMAVSELVGAIRGESPLSNRLTKLPCRLVVRQSSIRAQAPKPEIVMDAAKIMISD